MSGTRKLAAILVSDVVGYSRLAGADEDRTLARLRTLRSDLIDPIISVHHGRVVKRTGDGSIIEFRSVVDAVRCAVEVQTAMIERNTGVPPEKRIEFRVGVHLGDVVEESDGDLMGDGVNIAARLEGIAKPGAICLSEDAYRQVKGRLDLKVSDLGPTQLKNIAEPVRVYALEVGAHGPCEGLPAPATREPRKRSVLALSALAIALLLAAGAAAWHFAAANRSPAIASRRPPRPRISPSSCCRSPISPAIRPRTISPTALPRISPPTFRASATPSSSRATPPSLIKGKNARRQGDRQGARRSLRARRLRAARSEPSARQRAAHRRRDPARICGPSASRKTARRPLQLQDDIVASLAGQLGVELIDRTRRAARNGRQIPIRWTSISRECRWFNKGRNAAKHGRKRAVSSNARWRLIPTISTRRSARPTADAQAALGYSVDDKAERLVTVEAT